MTPDRLVTGAIPAGRTTAQRLSAADFHRDVLAGSPRTAVFDCDGTLWAGDAGYEFMLWSITTGLVSPERAKWMENRYALYRAGALSEVAICGEMVQLYAGLPEADLRRAARLFVDEYVAPRIFPEMKELVAALHAAGCDLWAVSSTNHWIIEEGVGPFAIAPDRILAARVRVEDGIATSELLDVPTDEGKAVALRGVGHSAPDCVFGNSIHDAAMLGLARHPYAVNPTPALVDIASSHHWPIFFPASAVSHR